MHPRNYHKDGYPMAALCESYPALRPHIINAKSGKKSIDFANPDAVVALNGALLAHYYNVERWQLPKGYLCPPIPGRADYIHGIADLLAESAVDVRSNEKAEAVKGAHIKGLDVGVGANAIYPIIGSQVYGWSFVGSDIDKNSCDNALKIVKSNKVLRPLISIKQQIKPEHIFKNIIENNERFAFTMCNPPFHKSKRDALAGSTRKSKNLAANKLKRSGKGSSASSRESNAGTSLNFAGQANELWCEGGELAFIQRMIKESIEIKDNVGWFTCLVSKSEHLAPIKKSLAYYSTENDCVLVHKVVNMGQGNKLSRFIAWSFQ
ncbi:23S rRNA (adenine(1618)-N(6))-methyltransferase RlmF [Alteromonas hispanica]|uniref:Ribosomal RNA large subunit methyltransferase F n=1 Tax=Alteromonas hispanica TaxID=315421 RepID=A0A6L9MV29_9ALTE|nr:23S rRNA (adenine(1618)-N(6))-methyltransferase RlmF [Alteromonas hispanica]NDW21661.1 23S rRNA (adenine(1618)-N(6))-methyltransferase RlmF [Alteromonas hispanica]